LNIAGQGNFEVDIPFLGIDHRIKKEKNCRLQIENKGQSVASFRRKLRRCPVPSVSTKIIKFREEREKIHRKK